MLPRGAWNGHEKAGRHFLEHQLRLLAGWDGGDIFLDPNSCPRVFLNNPPGLSSGSVWVMRIGMCGRRGKRPVMPSLPFAGPETLRRPFEGNSRSYTPRPSVFEGVQAYRLPGPKPSACLSKATLAATRHGHLFLRAFKPAVYRAPNPSNAPAGLSKATLAATRHGHLFLRAFKPAVCRAPNHSNPPAGLSKATLAATRHGHLFLKVFKPTVCRAPNPSNPPAGLSKATLAATHHPAVCRAPNPPQAFRRQLSRLHATTICF